MLCFPAVLLLNACGASDPMTGRAILDQLRDSGVAVSGQLYGTGQMSMPSELHPLPQSGITLAELIEAAVATHPRLKAAGARVGEATGRAWQASLYPNPEVGASIQDIGSREGIDGSTIMLSLNQPIVIGQRLRAAVSAADLETQVELSRMEAERRDVLADVAVVHATLLSLMAQEQALHEAIDSATEMMKIVESRVEAHAAPEADLLRPRVETARMEGELTHLRVTRIAAEERLAILVGVDRIAGNSLAPALNTRPEMLDRVALSRLIKTEHPRLIVLESEAQAARASVSLVDASRTPDVALSMGVGYDDEDSEGVVEFGVGTVVPIWDDRQGDLLAARFQVIRIEQERATLEKQLLGELTQVLAQYESARQQLRVLQEQTLLDAQRAFDQINASYRGGRSAFIEVLDAQRTLIEIRRSEARLAGDAAVARASIIRLVGVDPMTQHMSENNRS